MGSLGDGRKDIPGCGICKCEGTECETRWYFIALGPANNFAKWKASVTEENLFVP